MGGGVTRLLVGLLGNDALKHVSFISNKTLLNIPALIDGHHIITSSTKGEWGWLVANKVWCQIPNERVRRKFSELRSKDLFGLPQDECIPHSIHEPRPLRPAPGSFREAESTSSAQPPSLASLQAEIRALQIGQNYQTDLLYNMFAQGVASGTYQPYLNFPHFPMQQGPLPGWQGGQPTYPYYPFRPEGVDYRFSGGSDPSYDPNIPPLNPGEPVPQSFHDSVPPMEETWGHAPMPPWGDYSD